MLLFSFYLINFFFHENCFYFFMFRDVPECSGMFHVPGALSIYEKNPEISVVVKVEFPIGKKLFHLVVNPGTWPGARPWTWNWYKLREI